MNRHYRLLSETVVPYHDGDEHVTTIRMYDVDDETREFLSAVQSYQMNDGTYDHNNPAPLEVLEACNVEQAIMLDLGLQDDISVPPGARYYRYEASYIMHVVMVAETMAYNV